MKKTLIPGIAGEARHRVVTENLVSFRRPGMPPVFATPWLMRYQKGETDETKARGGSTHQATQRRTTDETRGS